LHPFVFTGEKSLPLVVPMGSVIFSLKGVI
jgi:hypothetical protein